MVIKEGNNLKQIFPNSFWYSGLQFNHINKYLSEKISNGAARFYYTVNYCDTQHDPKTHSIKFCYILME
jgi:hypothetical protein